MSISGQPSCSGLVHHPVAVGLLLQDDHDGVVLEAQRDVRPPEPVDRLLGAAARRLGLADGTDAPRPVPRAQPPVRRHRDLLAVRLDLARPRAHLREAACVEREPAALTPDVARLLDRRERAVPCEIEREALGPGFADQPDLLERLDDLDPVRSDLLVEPLVAERVGHADRELAVAPAQRGVRVDDAEVRVDPEPGDEEQLPGAVVGVEVTTVVRVAVTRVDVTHGQRRLMDRVLVERDRHGDLQAGEAGSGTLVPRQRCLTRHELLVGN
jgi:hypothetical protein